MKRTNKRNPYENSEIAPEGRMDVILRAHENSYEDHGYKF